MPSAGILQPKNSFLEVVDPTVGDDTTLGYKTGSRWINTVLNRHFVNFDASTGAAVWEETGDKGVINEFIATSGQTVFTLSQVPLDLGLLSLTINGVGTVRGASKDFTVSGDTLTMTDNRFTLDGERLIVRYV